MKKNIVVIFLSFTVWVSGVGDSFFLLDKDSEKPFGPFLFADGSLIKLGSKEYVIIKQSPSKIPIREKLQQIVIPSLDFRETDLRDIVEFFREESRKYDPEKFGVNFVLIPKRVRGVSETGQITSLKYPKITMNLKALSLYDILNLIRQSTGCQFRVQSNTVIIYPP